MRLNRIDRITALEQGQRVEAVRTVAMTEDLLATHFPRFPVLPGVLVADAMAQAAGWLVAAAHGFERRPALAAVREAKFRHYVRPGDQLVVDATLIQLTPDGATASVRARVDDRVVATIREMLFRCTPGSPAWANAARTELRALTGRCGGASQDDERGRHGA